MNKMIPSEVINVDENGNVEINGTTKLNGGLEPIHHYEFDADINGESNHIVFEVFFEIQGMQGFTCIGSINNTTYGENAYMGLCEYRMDNGELQFLRILYYYDSEEPYIERYNVGETTYTSKSIIYAKVNETQSKLFTHILTLTADKSFTLIYQSTKDLNVNSIADLRTIMNVTSTSDNVILPVCASDLSGTAALQVTTALCKIGTANVTAVTDKVTTL